jgi:rhodanese-related sulfurtransferase
MTDWDDKRHMYKLEPNQDFIPELERRLKENGADQDAPIILICRSGDRSSKAADRLQVAGYTKGIRWPRASRAIPSRGGPTDRAARGQWLEERQVAVDLQAGQGKDVFCALTDIINTS